MKRNRKWLLVIALVLSLTMAIGGTLAYLTDRDTVENTFTMGNVDIAVEENFDKDSQLNPGVSVTKEAGIKNIHSTEPAYVWMVVSVPSTLARYIELDWADNYSATSVTSPHEGYVGYLVKYPTPLSADTSTGNMLESVKLAANVDYQEGTGYVAVSGGQTIPLGELTDVEIMVDGFAIQTEGFDDVSAAYNAYTTQWKGLNGGESGNGGETVEVNTAAALQDALAAGNSVNLTADVIVDDATVQASTHVDMNLQDHTLSSSIRNDGVLDISDGTLNANKVGIDNFGTATVTNVTMNAGSNADYAFIGKAGSTSTINGLELTSAGGGIGATEGSTVTFNSGSVVVDSGSTSARYNVYAVGEGTVVTINDGSFSFSATKNQKRAYIYCGSGATVYVNGGTFGKASTRDGYTAGILGDGTVIITGGTFGFDPTQWVAEGYVATQNGSIWTVSAQ